MQQSCCDMFGITVEKSMVMRMSSDMMEPIELIHHSSSNEHSSPPPLEIQTCSGDEDGNSSENQNRSPPTSCENSTMEEPKTKKRRKQSNPLRYQTTPVMPLLESEECNPIIEEPSDEALDLQNKVETKSEDSPLAPSARCRHCSETFETDDMLRVHIEEEHNVQKELERQLQQQSYNKTTSGNNNREGSSETAKVNSPKSCNDMSLQQIVSVDQTRNSPCDGLINENREYKSPHFPFPPIPPFIPFSRSDDSKPGNMPVPPSMFPNPMMPFLFPVIPQGQTPPATNGNSHSGQGVRIFNLEAYCELCNKEFCNKYFLKTHKANKHGIYSVETIVSTPYGGPFISPSLNSPIPIPHMLQTSTAEPLQARTGLFNMESYCEICQKEFCNKYFLKKHRQKIHGIIEPGQNTSPCTTPQDTTSNSPVMTTSALALTSAPSFGEKCQDENKSDTPNNPSKLEFSSIFNMHNHKPGTPAISSAGVVPPPNSSSNSCPPVTSGAMVVSLLSPGNQTPSNENSVSHVFTPEKLREMGVINADAFCELCCKEFCNKYFLRTHKLNKHGINMPEISPGRPGQPSSSHSQGSHSNEKGELFFEDGRIPEELLQEPTPGLTFEGLTGELSCEFCNRPFSSLYLLKMHKFYSHNIPYIKEESKSKPNSPTGEHNNQENKENEFLKPHLPISLPQTSLISETSPTSLQEDAASQDLQKLQSMIRELNASAGSESSKIVCNLCRLEFDNKYFLRAHMMNEHGVLPNEDGHVTGQNNSESNGQPKISENSTDFQRVNFNNTSPSVDSEAYCEICQKEFCSKYFLKTHKQNIHGLPMDMSSNNPKKSLAEEVCQIKTIVNNTISTALVPFVPNSSSAPCTGVTTPTSCTGSQPHPVLTPFSSVSSQIPVITSGNSPATSLNLVSSPSVSLPATQPSSTAAPVCLGSSVLTPTSSRTLSIIPMSTMNHVSNVGHLPSNLTIPKMSPMCSISHNISLPSSTTSTSSNNLSSISQMAIAHTTHLPNLHSSTNVLSSLDKPRSLTGRNYCNICNKELCNKYFMKTHMLKMHGINLDSQPHEAARISTIGGVQCDICQKELCSKYFLKVHKQNTHGIFEEGSQGKDIRDHPPFLEKEQPLQGLDLSDPSGRYFSHYPEICPVCNCRFKSIKWLKAHMISDHGNLLKENFPHNPLPSTPEDSNMDDSSCLCVLCGQGFGDKVALHVHLIKDHQSTSDEIVAANSNSGIIKTSTASDSSATAMALVPVNGSASPVSGGNNLPRPSHPKPHGGSRIYHCSFCVYSTRWLSNLYAHEKRHTGVITEGEKKFVCRVCHRAYRYNHSLQRHFLSHRAAGLNVKDLSQPLIMTSQLSSSFSRPWSFHKKTSDLQGKGKIKRYRCSKCSKKFRSRELCLAHIHATHKRGSMLQKSVKPFRCRFCGFMTRVWNVLRIHINRQHHNEIMESKQQFDNLSGDEKSVHSDISNPAEPPTISTPPEAPSPKMSVQDGFPSGMPPPPPNSPHLPMTFAMPQNPPTAGSFIMQPFLIAQPDCDGVTRNGTFVPSLVYLPVCQKISQPMTVAFTLTPA